MRRCPTKKGSCWYKIFRLNGSALYTQYNYCAVTSCGIIYAPARIRRVGKVMSILS